MELWPEPIIRTAKRKSGLPASALALSNLHIYLHLLPFYLPALLCSELRPFNPLILRLGQKLADAIRTR